MNQVSWSQADRRKEHYETFNAEREEQRNKLRAKYGLKSDSSPNTSETPHTEDQLVVVGDEEKEKVGDEKKDGDCCVMWEY